MHWLSNSACLLTSWYGSLFTYWYDLLFTYFPLTYYFTLNFSLPASPPPSNIYIHIPGRLYTQNHTAVTYHFSHRLLTHILLTHLLLHVKFLPSLLPPSPQYIHPHPRSVIHTKAHSCHISSSTMYALMSSHKHSYLMTLPYA